MRQFIHDDSDSLRVTSEQPTESRSSTTISVFDSVIVAHLGTVLTSPIDAIRFGDVMPELPLGSHGKLEVTVKFTPSDT